MSDVRPTAENDALLRDLSRAMKPPHTIACPSGSITACECSARAGVESVARVMRERMAEAWDEGHSTNNGGCVYWPDCAANGHHVNPYHVIPPGSSEETP